jgi:excisionase family DNA binding protein
VPRGCGATVLDDAANHEAVQAMMTVRQVADRLQCSVGLVYALCAGGYLKHHRLGIGRGTIRVTEVQLQRFIDSTTITVSSPPPVALKHIRLPS